MIRSAHVLNDGHIIPAIGFGVFRVPNEQAALAVEQALGAGFRAIDTAAYYGNEDGTGRGIQASGVSRGSVHLTTKIWHTELGYDKTLRSIQRSLHLLGTDYLDSALIHWPVPSRNLYVDSWQALIRAKDNGLVRSIGVSNFNPAHIARLIDETGVTPAINQVELHPRLPQHEVRSFGQLHGILTQAWSPLGHGQLLTHKTVVDVAKRTTGATPAQVLLAWSLHYGIMPITKTLSVSRMQSNLEALGLQLAQPEISSLDAIADGYRTGPDPETYGMLAAIPDTGNLNTHS